MTTVEQINIRGLEIDKTVKGFALIEYIFKNDCMVTSTSADSVRWYQETAADLTPTAPNKFANISPLSDFPNAEVNWTRNTTYIRKYGVGAMISMEDIRSADIDVLTRTLLRLTRAVVKQVDSRIWDVMTDNRSSANVNVVTCFGPWNSGGYTANPIQDILNAKKLLFSGGYQADGASLYINERTYVALFDWIYQKGAQAQSFVSTKLDGGSITQLLGLNIKVSPNVTADYGAVVIPQRACTWKSFQDTTARTEEVVGIGTKIKVWEEGEGILTDPRAVVLLSNIEA